MTFTYRNIVNDSEWSLIDIVPSSMSNNISSTNINVTLNPDRFSDLQSKNNKSSTFEKNNKFSIWNQNNVELSDINNNNNIINIIKSDNPTFISNTMPKRTSNTISKQNSLGYFAVNNDKH